jgi:hypothetical protein
VNYISPLTKFGEQYERNISIVHEKREYMVRLVDCLPEDLNYTLQDENFCKNRPVAVLFYIISTAIHAKRRHSLRKTWAQQRTWQSVSFSTLFFVGRPASEESQRDLEDEWQQYGDVVQIDMVDTYENLTLKGVAAVKWLSTYCTPYVQYVIKVDDDVVVDTPSIAELMTSQILPQGPGHVGKLLCLLLIKSPVFRDNSTKWMVPAHVLPGLEFYPPYCTGGFYGYPAYILPMLHQAAMGTPFFWLEDVYFNGFVLPQLRIKVMQYVNVFPMLQIAMEKYLLQPQANIIFLFHDEDIHRYWSNILKRYQ